MGQLLRIDGDALVIQYNNPVLAISVKEGLLSSLPEKRMLAHWHEDLEFLHITAGKMITRLNGYDIHLDTGDVIFINSRQLHLSFGDTRDSSFQLVQIHPRLLTPAIPHGSVAEELLQDIRFRCYVFKNPSDECDQIISILNALHHEALEKESFYELQVVSLACQLFHSVCKHYHPSSRVSTLPSEFDQDIQRKMIAYIYAHYSENITLNQIAAAGNVSRSKCCKLFARYLGQSPIDFLVDYRIEEGARLLIETIDPISQIASACGFADQSYFNRVFRRKLNCSPGEFRKQKEARISPAS